MPKSPPLNLIGKPLALQDLKDLLKTAVEEPNTVRKGEKFEVFFGNFMAQQEGFVFLRLHTRSRVGEIDYFYRSEHRDHPLFQKFPYLFIECKNWHDPVSSEKMNHFIRLMQAKSLFSCCGIYITTSYFSPEALTAVRDARMKDGTMVILVDNRELNMMMEKGFKVFIQEKCDEIMAKA